MACGDGTMQDSGQISEKPVEKGGTSRAHNSKLFRRSSGGLEQVNHHITDGKNTLEELKDLYWSVIENAHIVIAQIDADYKILMVNGEVGRPSGVVGDRE
jgi:hypothetical protein